MTDTNEYFYLKLGIPRGPYNREQLIQLAKDEKIKANTLCIRNDEPSQKAEVFFGSFWQEINKHVVSKHEKIRVEKEERKFEIERTKAENARRKQLAKEEKQKQKEALRLASMANNRESESVTLTQNTASQTLYSSQQTDGNVCCPYCAVENSSIAVQCFACNMLF